MKFYGDYHTHTVFSDCLNTVANVAKTAKEKGLKQVAVTDHGFANVCCALKRWKFKLQTKYVEKARAEIDGIEILQGIEADIIDTSGKVDLRPSDMDKLDILVCGFHRFVHSTGIKDYFGYILYNGFFSKLLKQPSEKAVAKNTAAFIAAIEKYPIDILSHINQHAVVDSRAVAEAAARFGTYIEINMKHFELTEKYIEDMLPTDCVFIVNSDSHQLAPIGDFDRVFALIEKYNIPEERIANLNKEPVFTRLAEYKKQRIKNGQAKL